MQASDIATEVMYQVAKIQSKYWKSIDVQACLPVDGESRSLWQVFLPIDNRASSMQKSLRTRISTRWRICQVSCSAEIVHDVRLS